MKTTRNLLILCIMLISPSLFALTTVLQPGQADSKDTVISMQNPTNNYSTESNMWIIQKSWGEAEQQFGLFQFDIPSELANATITNATFDFYVYRTFFEASNNVSANKVSSTWEEASVTWNTSPDYEQTSIGSVTLIGNVDPNPLMSMYQPYWAQMDITDAVQNWVDGTWLNYGFLLKPVGSINDKFELLTSENINNELHPKLTIEYTPSVPEPSAFLLFFIGIGIIGRKRKK